MPKLKSFFKFFFFLQIFNVEQLTINHQTIQPNLTENKFIFCLKRNLNQLKFIPKKPLRALKTWNGRRRPTFFFYFSLWFSIPPFPDLYLFLSLKRERGTVFLSSLALHYIIVALHITLQPWLFSFFLPIGEFGKVAF